MSFVAINRNQTTLRIADVLFTKLLDIELPQVERRHRCDLFVDADLNYHLPPLKRMTNLVFRVPLCEWRKQRDVIGKSFLEGVKVPIVVELPDTRFSFSGYVDSYSAATPYDGLHYMEVKVRPSGPMKVETIQEEQMKVITKESVKRNRYYVGSLDALRRNWGHETLEGATEHAAALIDGEGSHFGARPQTDEQFIVKIVRVVRRKKTPVTIENVK